MFADFLSKAREFYQFIGRRTFFVLGMSLFVAGGVFAAELNFAYAIQAFLSSLDLIKSENVHLPSWYPTLTKSRALYLFVGITGARAIFLWLQAYFQEIITENFKAQQRDFLLRQTFLSKSPSSHRISNLFGEGVNAGAVWIRSLQVIVAWTPLILAVVCTLFYFSIPLAFVVLLLAGLAPLLVRRLHQKLKSTSNEVKSEWDQLNHRLILGIRNLLFLRLHGRDQAELAQAQQGLERYRLHAVQSLTVGATLYTYPHFIGVFLIAFSTVVAQQMNWLSGGALLIFFYLLFRALQTTALIAYALTNLTYQNPQMKSLWNYWLEAKGIHSSNSNEIISKQVDLEPGPAGWILENLSFEFSKGRGSVLKNLNLEIQPGSTTIIRGSSGAGKSTLLSLLLGQAEPSSGSIDVVQNKSRTPLRMVKTSLLRKVGYVGPEPFFIEGSIRENLLYGSDQEIRLAFENRLPEILRLAGAEFVYQIPEGLEFKMSDQGQGLSAGQKQRLALARALLRNPKIIILDEATSNLDPETEAHIAQSLKILAKDLTLVVVTHRESMKARLGGREFDLKDGGLTPSKTPLASPFSGSRDDLDIADATPV